MTRLKIGAKALALGALLASAATAQPRPSIVTNPDWLRKPSGEDMANNYPQTATMLSLAGRVILHCSVAASGRLDGCEVPTETPKGLGFGNAALALSRQFLMRPQTRDGAPISGGQINIPIVFRLPASSPPQDPPAPAPESAAMLALALKVVAAAKTTDRAAQSYEQAATAFESGRVADVSPENAAAIAKAIRATYPGRLRDAADGQARVYASLFTAKELAELEAFFKTKAAAAIYGQTNEARALDAGLAALGRQRQAAISRDIFCGTHSCAPVDGGEAPPWAHVPTLEQVFQSWPPLARTFNLPGSAQLTCTVIAGGALSGCQITRQTPTGLGFGGAAQTLAGYYSLDLTAPKVAKVGEAVRFEVHFDAAADFDTPAAPAPAARSPGSLAMARELLAAVNPGAPSATALARQRAATLPPAPGVTRADQTAVFDVVDQAYLRARAEILDRRASWLTTQLTDAELVAALKTWRGPLATKWQAHGDALLLAQQKVTFDINVQVWLDVGKAFCAEQACFTPPALPPLQPAIAASPAASTRTP